MAVDYPSAVRNGAAQATRLHQLLGTRGTMSNGGGIDVFGCTHTVGLECVLRPLKGLLGAYIPTPIPGVMVTTERPLSIQRFTAAHELGHFQLGHLPSLDDESNILRRMAMSASDRIPSSELQEVEADSFAVNFMMPRWLIEWHCSRQGWQASTLKEPRFVYQLSLRMGVSYEAMTWTLQRYRIISVSEGNVLRRVQPRSLKVELLAEYRPKNYYGDVWLLTERDAGTQIDGSRNDYFVLRLNEHSGGGYLWNIDELRRSGFVIVRDGRIDIESEGVGSHTVREVTTALEEARRGTLQLDESRPWESDSPLNQIAISYDLTGPEEAGYSRAEQRRLLEAA